MKKMIVCFALTLTCLLVTAPAYGQLDFGENYTTSDEVFLVVHVKPYPNMRKIVGEYLVCRIDLKQALVCRARVDHGPLAVEG